MSPSSLWPCLAVLLCACNWDLKRLLANPGGVVRFELVESKSGAKLLISTTGQYFCVFLMLSEYVNLSRAQSVSVTANVFHCSPRFFKVTGGSLTEGELSLSAACFPVTVELTFSSLL